MPQKIRKKLSRKENQILTCPSNLNMITNTYIKKGWGSLVRTYYKKKIGKEAVRRASSKIPPDITLVFIGAVRRYMVLHLFECLCRKTEYIALGSTNITSDFDLTLLGEQANECMKKLFFYFLKLYGNTLAHAFDTNLYTIGYHLVTPHMRILPETVIIPDTSFAVFVSRSSADIRLEIEWSLAKLANCPKNYLHYITKHYPIFTPWLRRAKTKVYVAKKMIRSEHTLTLKKYGRKYKNKETRRLITRYNLYYTIARYIYATYIYNNLATPSKLKLPADMQTLFDLLGFANYVSIEAYYTSATVIFVVLKLQGEKNVQGLKMCHYICAALENLGDLINHMTHEKDRFGPTLLLKYSKYLYRIYSALSYIDSKGPFKRLATKIKEYVLPHRGSTRTVSDLEKKLGIRPARSVDEFLKHVIDRVFPTLASKLSKS